MLRTGMRTRAAAVGLLGLLVTAPPPAAADDDDGDYRHRGRGYHRHHDYDDDGHGRHHGKHRKHWKHHEVHRHGDWCPPGHRHPPGRRIGWWDPRDDWRWRHYRRPVVIESPYYCAPCGHWYRDRGAFHSHVYGHHDLPRRLFADAVAQVVWGWVYFGL